LANDYNFIQIWQFKLLSAFLALGAFLYTGSRAHALEYSFNGSWIEQAEVRQLNQNGLSNVTNTQDLYTLIDLRNKIHESAFTFRVDPELRGLWSQAVSLKPTDPAYLTVNSPPRFFNFQRTLASSSDALYVVDLDRIDVSYSLDNAELFAGRRPIGIGVLRAFPVWNKFTKPLPTISGYPLVFNPELAGARYQFESVAAQAFQIRGATMADTVSLAEVGYYGDLFELHALGSYWWQEWVVGAAAVANIGGVTFRDELLYIDIDSNVTNQLQNGIEAEYVFDPKWSGLLSVLIFSRGARSVNDYSLESPTRFTSLRAFAYGFLSVGYKVTPYFNLSVSDTLNCVDLSNYVLVKATYSASQNIDLYLDFNFPVGRDYGEFSAHAINFTNGTSIGLPAQFDGGLRWFF
jgi:hypothetical protein